MPDIRRLRRIVSVVRYDLVVGCGAGGSSIGRGPLGALGALRRLMFGGCGAGGGTMGASMGAFGGCGAGGLTLGAVPARTVGADVDSSIPAEIPERARI